MTGLEVTRLLAVEKAARAYGRHSHGNMTGAAYRAREEARDVLLDALSELDVCRTTARPPVPSVIAIPRVSGIS